MFKSIDLVATNSIFCTITIVQNWRVVSSATPASGIHVHLYMHANWT